MDPYASSKTTFSAIASGLVPAATATDIFTICGAANKVIRVKKIVVSGIATAASNTIFQLIKRSTAGTGGTSTAPSAIAHDSRDGAARATLKAYTANPTVGTPVGTVASRRVILSTAAGDVYAAPVVFDFYPRGEKEIVLTSALECLALNLAGVTITGGSLEVEITWTEE